MCGSTAPATGPGPARAGAKRRWSWRRRRGFPRSLAAPSRRSGGGGGRGPPRGVPPPPRRAGRAMGGTRSGSGRRGLARRYGASLLLAALAAACVGLALDGRANLERLTGIQTVSYRSAAEVSLERSIATSPQPQPLPSVVPVSHDAAGSAIDSSSYASPAHGGEGSFLIYLPPGYADRK